MKNDVFYSDQVVYLIIYDVFYLIVYDVFYSDQVVYLIIHDGFYTSQVVIGISFSINSMMGQNRSFSLVKLEGSWLFY